MKIFNYVEGLPVLTDIPSKEENGKRHYLTPNGVKLPSVTTILGHFKKDKINEWRKRVGHDEANRISNRASTRGTKFHNILEKYLGNSPLSSFLTESIMPDMKQAFWDIVPTIDRIDNIHYLEAKLWSEKLLAAGRTDVIGEFDGILSVIDFKTSTKPKPEHFIEDYFLQATAYAMMYEEKVGVPINQIVVIISVDNEKQPQIFIKEKTPYVDTLRNKIYKYHLDNYTYVGV